MSVKPSPAGKTPYCWGKLLKPLYSENGSPLESWMWPVERLTDQEFSNHIKTELLQRDKILAIDEALNMYGVTLLLLFPKAFHNMKPLSEYTAEQVKEALQWTKKVNPLIISARMCPKLRNTG